MRSGGDVLLSGFGRAGSSAAHVVDVDQGSLADAIAALPARGGIARGLGRSYGDSAQNGGGHVLRLLSRPSDIDLDETAGRVRVGGGVSIGELLASIVPRGWFVPVTPGTRFVTVGGAVAADVHGKNHHRDGSFGRHVVSLRLMTADGGIDEIGPDRCSDLFWATVGGMGLTGIVVDVTLRLIPIETARMSVSTRRLGDLDEVMAHMVAVDDGARYSVAWIDLLASGDRLGRGVVDSADHAALDELADLGAAERAYPLAVVESRRARLPPWSPRSGLVNRATVAAFNAAWFRRAPRSRDGALQPLGDFFYPLDRLAGWNRVYGAGGFVQYQIVVPFGAEATLRQIVERLSVARLPIFLAVLKRLGEGVSAPLSFPMPGWTLAVDIGAGVPDLARLLRALDELVLGAGGRHYLAKDFHLAPDSLRRGYPLLDRWLSTRERVDPSGVWMSDQARRLGLHGAAA